MIGEADSFCRCIGSPDLPFFCELTKSIGHTQALSSGLVLHQRAGAVVIGVNHCIVRRSYRFDAGQGVIFAGGPTYRFSCTIRVRCFEGPSCSVVFRQDGDKGRRRLVLPCLSSSSQTVIKRFSFCRVCIVKGIQIGASDDGVCGVQIFKRGLSFQGGVFIGGAD